MGACSSKSDQLAKAAGENSPAGIFIKGLIEKHKVGKTRDLTSDAEVELSLAMALEMMDSPLGLDAIASEVYADGLGENPTGDNCKPPNIILACKEAEGRAALLALKDTPCHLTVVFPMYHEQNRIKSKEEHENGQNFVRNKVKQLDWLVKDAEGMSYDIIAVDDGCDLGSTDLMKDIIEKESYGDRVRVAHIQEAIDQELEVFKPLKTPADSRKGGAVLYGLHLSAAQPHASAEGKAHLVLFTDSDLSGSMAMSGLVMSKILKDNTKFASAARYGYPTSYLVTEEGATGHPLSHYQQPNVVHITIRHFIRSLLLPDLAHMFDTNVGFKCWKVEDIPELLKPMSVFGPAFDMQLLLGALQYYKAQDEKLTADNIIGVAPILFVEDFAESNFTSNSTDPDASAKGFVRMAHEMSSMHTAYYASTKEEPSAEQKEWVEFIASLDLEKYKTMVAELEKEKGRKLPFEELFTVKQMSGYIGGEVAAKVEEPKKEEEKNSEAAPVAAAAVTEEKKESKIDWAHIRAKMPMEKTPEEKHQRMELFKQFDPNGNGYLSLAEVDKGVRDTLELEEIFDVKPVIMRAFQAAKSLNDKRGKPNSHGPDYVEKCEFRMLLVYIRQYFEIWQMFDEIDSSNDRRISIEEFKKAVPHIQKLGVQIDDVDASFKEIDANGGGVVLFDEFAHWALEKHLDLEEDDE